MAVILLRCETRDCFSGNVEGEKSPILNEIIWSGMTFNWDVIK